MDVKNKLKNAVNSVPAPQQDNYTQKETKECNISYYMNLIKKGCNIVLGGTAQDRNSFEKEYLNKNPGSKFVMYSEIENFKKNIFGPKTVFGVIQKAKSIKGTSTQDITRVFQNMNIAHLKDRAPTAMSGGQKVKCSMALYILEGKRSFLFVDGHPYGDVILSSVATDVHKDVTIVWVSSHTAEELLQNNFIENCNLIALDQASQAVIDNKNAVEDKKQIETTEVQEEIQPVLLVEEKKTVAEETEIMTETHAPQPVVKEEPKEAIVIPVNKTEETYTRDVDKSIMMMDAYIKKCKNSYTLWDFLTDKRDVEYWISTGFEKAVDVPVIYDGKQRIIRNTEATWEDLYIILSAITSFMVGGNIPHPYQKLYDVVNADRIEGTFEDILNDVLAEYEEVLCCLTAVLDDGEMSEDKLFIDVVNVLAQVWLTPEHAFVDGTDFAFAQAGKEITFDYKQYEYLNSAQDAGEKEELYFDEFVKAAEKCKTKEEFLTLVDRVNETESKDIALYIAKEFEEGIIMGQADKNLAKPGYIKAAELGSSTAAYRLAQLHLENGGKKFSEEYIDYMERALDNGEVSVAKELAKLYMDQRTKFYDIEKAAYALQRGRKYSDIDCMCEEAVLYMEYGKELNDDAAVVDMHIYSLLQESAARGNKKALKLFQEHFQI